jgi:hypothetical protein
MTEQALDVLGKAAEAHVQMRRRAERAEQPATLLGVRCRAQPGQARQGLMRHHPVALARADVCVACRHDGTVTRQILCSAAPRRACLSHGSAAISCTTHLASRCDQSVLARSQF